MSQKKCNFAIVRKFVLILAFFVGVCSLFAQKKDATSGVPPQGGAGIESTVPMQLPIEIRSWKIDQRLGIADSCSIEDTVVTSYQDNNPVNRYSIANSWTGNLGSPVQSKIFFDRTRKTAFPLANSYDAYAIDVEDIVFFNTKTPYANLTYRTALPRFMEEDYFSALFSMNFNKYFNVGGLVNVTLGRGQYQHQISRYVNGGFFASYTGRRYEFQAVMMINDIRNEENGGLREPLQIKDGDDYRFLDINLQGDAVGRYNNAILYYNHKYSLGFDRQRKLDNDSIVYDFVPVTSFIHTIKYENSKKRYSEQSVGDFYKNNYYSTESTRDSTRFQSLKNNFAITLEEKFNTLFKFGLAAFVEHDLVRQTVYSSHFKFIDVYQHNFYAGGKISKNEGNKALRYSFWGKVGFAGVSLGDIDINGDIKSEFRLWKDTVSIEAKGLFERIGQDYLFGHYTSNHFRWNKDFQPTTTIRVDASLSSLLTGVKIGFHLANIKDYAYYDYQAMPAQYNGNLQVMAFDLESNLKFWKFHFDNKMAYQISSNKDILPLPDFSVYSNLYFQSKFFGVLLSQIGVSCRYHTAYYGNAYMPALGQFYLQKERKIGNFPDINVYANFHLKRARFYFQYSHLNMYRFGGRGYELIPNYPINPATFQVGVSWNFYN